MPCYLRTTREKLSSEEMITPGTSHVAVMASKPTSPLLASHSEADWSFQRCAWSTTTIGTSCMHERKVCSESTVRRGPARPKQLRLCLEEWELLPRLQLRMGLQQASLQSKRLPIRTALGDRESKPRARSRRQYNPKCLPLLRALTARMAASTALMAHSGPTVPTEAHDTALAQWGCVALWVEWVG